MIADSVARMIAAHAAGENYTLSHQELTDYLFAIEWLAELMKEADNQRLVQQYNDSVAREFFRLAWSIE